MWTLWYKYNELGSVLTSLPITFQVLKAFKQPTYKLHAHSNVLETYIEHSVTLSPYCNTKQVINTSNTLVETLKQKIHTYEMETFKKE